MSFLDSLESTLKNLESREERDPKARKQRDSDRAAALAASPWAEKLKNGSYVQELLKSVARIGHETRTKVHVVWLDTTLRLEMRDRRLELRPNADGIVAVFLHDGKEEKSIPVDLNGNAEELVKGWLSPA